ncbi:uncharacterized protein LOC119721462 [Patiria miniata]|uniref:Globin domain-containing protein n=2 Tax=Patiria miniata TaxID=46514 RepID=A0A913Z9B0_PATMI|nr:uncharacterized protein LOC119721462 [Patiria miniata]
MVIPHPPHSPAWIYATDMSYFIVRVLLGHSFGLERGNIGVVVVCFLPVPIQGNEESLLGTGSGRPTVLGGREQKSTSYNKIRTRLLEKNPAIKNLFPFGKLNLSPEKLKDNADLRAHGKNVMETIGTAVETLDNPGKLVPFLKDLGARHNAYGTKPEHFKPLAEALIFTLKDGLPPKVFTAEVQGAWENALKVVAELMSEAMRSDDADVGPMSQRDKRLVRECWKVIQKDMVNLGAALFVRLLEKSPPIQNLFTFGKLNLSAEKLKRNKDLRSHGQRVMSTIGAVVMGLDDPDIIATILEDLGARHQMYGAKPEHFPALVEALMHSLKNGLPPKLFTPEAQEAWQNLMKMVATSMSKTMRSGSSEDEGPISSKNKRLVQASWKIMEKDAVNLGAVLFARLLEKNPSIQKLFPFGKLNLPPDKLRQNPDLRAHGKGVMETIGILVASLDDLKDIVPTLKELGARHNSYGAKPEHFPALVEAFMFSMKTRVSAEVFTAEVQEAWRNVLKVVDVTMSTSMSSHSNGASDVTISPKDKQLAQGSWKFIQKDLVNLGASMFVRLLEKNPGIRKTFSFGRLNLPPDKLRQNPDLRAHGKGVMLTFGTLVSGADDLGKIIPMMEDLGARHKTYGAKPAHFPAIVEAFMYSLKKGLSPKIFTPDVQEAWRNILSVVAVTMGSTMSSDESGVSEEESTASPISPKDKQLVQNSWKFVQKDLVNLGAVMFVRLLEKNPSVQNLFSFGKLNLPPEKLKQNPDLRAHGKGVMETIGTAVAGLDDLGRIVPILEEVGARHKIYGARPEHFPAVVEALMYSLKQGLSPNVFTSETQEAWRNILKVVDVTMSRTMRLDENGNSEEGLISLRDKRLVQKSWKVMQKDSVNLGAALFARFLDRNPSIRELFPFGKSSVPPQMLKHNSDLRAHGKGVMETIGTAVDGLDDLGKIVPILKDLGTRHNVYGAKPEHFQPLVDAFMYTMRNGLSSKEFTPDVQDAWENIWKVLAEVMSNGME